MAPESANGQLWTRRFSFIKRRNLQLEYAQINDGNSPSELRRPRGQLVVRAKIRRGGQGSDADGCALQGSRRHRN